MTNPIILFKVISMSKNFLPNSNFVSGYDLLINETFASTGTATSPFVQDTGMQQRSRQGRGLVSGGFVDGRYSEVVLSAWLYVVSLTSLEIRATVRFTDNSVQDFYFDFERTRNSRTAQPFNRHLPRTRTIYATRN